jgi:hypothetical protein
MTSNFFSIPIEEDGAKLIISRHIGSYLCPNCAQNLSEISKDIQIYLKPNDLKNQITTEVNPYIFRFPFILCLLHTVEVTGSNPVSPTTFFSIT